MLEKQMPLEEMKLLVGMNFLINCRYFDHTLTFDGLVQLSTIVQSYDYTLSTIRVCNSHMVSTPAIWTVNTPVKDTLLLQCYKM